MKSINDVKIDDFKNIVKENFLKNKIKDNTDGLDEEVMCYQMIFHDSEFHHIMTNPYLLYEVAREHSDTLVRFFNGLTKPSLGSELKTDFEFDDDTKHWHLSSYALVKFIK